MLGQTKPRVSPVNTFTLRWLSSQWLIGEQQYSEEEAVQTTLSATLGTDNGAARA